MNIKQFCLDHDVRIDNTLNAELNEIIAIGDYHLYIDKYNDPFYLGVTWSIYADYMNNFIYVEMAYEGKLHVARMNSPVLWPNLEDRKNIDDQDSQNADYLSDLLILIHIEKLSLNDAMDKFQKIWGEENK